MVILDTSIIIDHLRQEGQRSKLDKIREQFPKEQLAVSVISVQELYEGQSTRDDNREKAMLGLLAALKILPYTFEVAQKAGQLVRNLKFPVEFSDAAIAATVVINNAKLASLNKKHFQDIPDLEFF